MTKLICVIVGVGPGNGIAFAKLFSQKGYTLALLARSDNVTLLFSKKLKDAHAFQYDVNDADSVAQ